MKRFVITTLCLLLGLIAGICVESNDVQALPVLNEVESANESNQANSDAKARNTPTFTESETNVFRETFENAVPTFAVTLTVKGADGRTDGRFVVEEEAVFTVQSERDGYLYLFNEYTDKDGKVQIRKIFPNAKEDNFIAAKTEVVFPRSKDGFKFIVEEANGRERLMALVVDRKYPPFEKMKFNNKKAIEESGATLAKCFASVYDNNDQTEEESQDDVSSSDDAEQATEPEEDDAEQATESEEDDAEQAAESEKDDAKQAKKPKKDDAETPLGFGRRTLRVDTFATEQERSYIPKRTIFVGIGVDKFQFAGMGILNLRACVNDVVDFKDLLIQQGVVKEEDCHILLNKDATRENVRRLFQVTLPELAASGASIIVCFSSHGRSVASVEKNRARGREVYLVLYDTNPKDLYHTAVSSNEFGDWAQALQNCRVLFLFDNCYSALMIDERYKWDEFINPVTTAKSLGQPNVCVIASSSPDQESAFESSKGLLYRSRPHSLMTNNILKALEKESSLSAKKLYEIVKPVVEERYGKIYGKNKSSAQYMNYASSLGKDDFIVNPTPETAQDE